MVEQHGRTLSRLDLARERGGPALLEHGEERRCDLAPGVLDGAGAIAAAERRIRAVGGQPEEDRPEPSGRFAALGRAG